MAAIISLACDGGGQYLNHSPCKVVQNALRTETACHGISLACVEAIVKLAHERGAIAHGDRFRDAISGSRTKIESVTD